MPTIQPMTFGERLEEVLRQHGLSKRKLAKRWGKDRSYVYKLTKGGIDWPGFGVVLELAEVIGCSVETLAMGVTYGDGGSEYRGPGKKRKAAGDDKGN